MSSPKIVCSKCKKEISLTGLVGRRDECPNCRADLHACVNCAHYDPKVYNECRETQADRVLEKERSNFCDFFSAQTGQNNLQEQKNKMLSAAEALFKKK